MLKYAGVHTYPQVMVLTERPEEVQRSTFPKAAYAQAVRGEGMRRSVVQNYGCCDATGGACYSKRKRKRNNGQKPRTEQYEWRKARR